MLKSASTKFSHVHCHLVSSGIRVFGSTGNHIKAMDNYLYKDALMEAKGS